MTSDKNTYYSPTETQLYDEQTSASSNDDYSNDMCSVSYDIYSQDELTADNNDETKPEKTVRRKSYQAKPFSIVSYGPINVRVIHGDTPNLKTGRRSKFMELEGEEAKQREIRRQKNRDAAKKIKEKRTDIERDLLNEINQLEIQEKKLETNINNLSSYKEFLERVQKEKAGTSSELLQKEQNDILVKYDFNQSEEEPRSASPPWQLVFSIQ